MQARTEPLDWPFRRVPQTRHWLDIVVEAGEAVVWTTLYVAAVRISNAEVVGTVPVLSFQAGVALGALLRLGYRASFYIALGIGIELLSGPLSTLAATAVFLGTLVQALAGKYLFDEHDDISVNITNDPRKLARFLLLGALTSAIIGSTIHAAMICVDGLAPWPSFGWLWVTLWLSNALGILFITPLFVRNPVDEITDDIGEITTRGARIFEGALLAICMLGAGAALFGVRPFADGVNYLYLFVPLMVWSAFHFGVRGASFAALAVLAPALWATSHGTGAVWSVFGDLLRLENVIRFQFLVLMLGGTALILAAAVAAFREEELGQKRAQLRLRHQVDRQSIELRSSNISLHAQIAERVQVEEALRASQARYQELFENANDIVYTHDLQGRFTSLNKAGEEVTGYRREELLGNSIDQLVVPEDLTRAKEMIQKKIDANVSTVYELEIIAKDGRRVPLEVSTRIIYQNDRPVGIQGIARDISDRRRAEEERQRLEERIRYAQKQESLKGLAEGLAHDFNNLLTRIVANVGVATLDLTQDSPVRTSLKKIETAADHASELVDQLLAYAGKGKRKVAAVDLSLVVEKMASLLESVISEDVSMAYDLQPDLPPVEADGAQIRQIVVNLVTNASDAILPRAGLIRIHTGKTLLTSEALQGLAADKGVTPGEFVYLEVSDDGSGISPQMRARIFDPFFTTKATGRGLGLAAVLGIVRAHKGAIQIESRPGEGTTFRVLLPVASCSAALASIESAGASPLK
ncbi:MAG: PAS domain S-box protein [Planctomycetota bacterium]